MIENFDQYTNTLFKPIRYYIGFSIAINLPDHIISLFVNELYQKLAMHTSELHLYHRAFHYDTAPRYIAKYYRSKNSLSL